VVRAAGILAAALVLLVFAARAATLLPLCLLANTWRPPASRISLRQAAVIWWAGSMRGAGEPQWGGMQRPRGLPLNVPLLLAVPDGGLPWTPDTPPPPRHHHHLLCSCHTAPSPPPQKRKPAVRVAPPCPAPPPWQ
jgi:hypothetical protein